MEPELVVHPIRWNLAPTAGENQPARNWLTFQSNRGLAPNTLDAYVRGIEIYFAFLIKQGVRVEDATRIEVGAYINSLLSRQPHALSSATIQQDHGGTPLLRVPCRGGNLPAQSSFESLAWRAEPRSPASAAPMDSY
jgi:hypothetical protein